MEIDKFESLRERLDDYLSKELELPNIREDLKIFVEGLGDHGWSIDYIKGLIDLTEHKDLIYDICKFLIMDPENKTNCVVIYGAPNAGKTKFL